MKLTNTIILMVFLTVGCGGASSRSKTPDTKPTIADLRQQAEDNPQSSDALKRLALAELLADDGDSARANEALENARRLSANDPLVTLMAGVELNLHGDTDAALDLLALGCALPLALVSASAQALASR